MTRARGLVPAGLGLSVLTTIALAIGHLEVGYVRDEGIYFEASREYAAWVAELGRDPARAWQPAVRDQTFRVNHEHPALMKTLAGLSARALARPPAPGTAVGEDDRGGRWPLAPEGAAMRLPAQILAGLGVGMLFVVAARRFGIAAGVLAALGFMLLPHVWFHAGLHAFDVPVAVAVLAVVLVYRKALQHPAYGLALGPVLGVAIAIKHNALFVAPLLALHCWATLLRGPHRRGPWTRFVALPLWSMAILAPLVAALLWPWLWHHTIDRVREYFEFHRQHNWYNMEFLGVNYNQPPMPIAYPWVMTWATVPTVILVLAAIGLVWGLVWPPEARAAHARGTAHARRALPGSFTRPVPELDTLTDTSLWGLFALWPIVLISLPSTPIFGGTKHWITAYPFIALLAAQGFAWLWAHAGIPWRGLGPTAVALVLVPSLLGTVAGHPYGLSQYAPLVGGPRGAAALGLNRGFWGHAVIPLLPTLAEHDRVYLGDLHELAWRQYVREGRVPTGIATAAIPRSQAGLVFHELHMATYEIDLWHAYGRGEPARVLELHDVPLTSVYER